MRTAPVVLLAAAVLGTGACRSMQPLPDVEGGVEIGLRRGAAWSTVTVKPPYVIGPRVTLHLTNHVFSGNIDGQPVHLQVEPDGIKGSGPSGQVSIDIDDSGDKLTIEGSWNGQRASFEITSDTMKGSLSVYRGRTLSGALYCQYVLDHVDTGGARVGTSICGGLPEETRLEVPRAAVGWLTRPELVVVLLALLSSPPFTEMELNR
jgi:hypothetical protein